MSVSRREFMRNSIGSAALMSLPAGAALAAQSPVAPAKPFKLAISTYSYWHFKTPKVPIEKVIDEAALLSVEGRHPAPANGK